MPGQAERVEKGSGGKVRKAGASSVTGRKLQKKPKSKDLSYRPACAPKIEQNSSPYLIRNTHPAEKTAASELPTETIEEEEEEKYQDSKQVPDEVTD